MLISVEQRHIDNGILRYCFGCPVALAIKENVDCICVGVCDYKILITDSNGHNQYYKCPRSVSRFIHKFDKKGKNNLHPFNFRLTRRKNAN